MPPEKRLNIGPSAIARQREASKVVPQTTIRTPTQMTNTKRATLTFTLCCVVFIAIRLFGVFYMIDQRAEPIEPDDAYLNSVQPGLQIAQAGEKQCEYLYSQVESASNKDTAVEAVSVYLAIAYDYHPVHTFIYAQAKKLGFQWRDIYWATTLFAQVFFGACLAAFLVVTLGWQWGGIALVICAFLDCRGFIFWFPNAHTYVIALGLAQWAVLFSNNRRIQWTIPLLAAATVVFHPGGVIVVGMTFLLYVTARRPPEKMAYWIPAAMSAIMAIGYLRHASQGYTHPNWDYLAELIENLKYMYSFFVQYDILYSTFKEHIATSYNALHVAHYAILTLHFIGFILLSRVFIKIYRARLFSEQQARMIQAMFMASLGAFGLSQVVLIPGVVGIIFVRVAPALVIFLITVALMTCRAVEQNNKTIPNSASILAKKWMVYSLAFLFIGYLSQRGLLAIQVMTMETVESNIVYSDDVFSSFNNELSKDDLVLFEDMGPLYYALANGMRSEKPVAGYLFDKDTIDNNYQGISFAIIDSPYAKSNSGYTVAKKGDIHVPREGRLELDFTRSTDPGTVFVRLVQGRESIGASDGSGKALPTRQNGQWLAVAPTGSKLVFQAGRQPFTISAISLDTAHGARWPWNSGIHFTWIDKFGKRLPFNFEFKAASPFTEGKDFEVWDDSSDFVILKRSNERGEAP